MLFRNHVTYALSILVRFRLNLLEAISLFGLMSEKVLELLILVKPVVMQLEPLKRVLIP